jgi:putative phage-type endonuclease
VKQQLSKYGIGGSDIGTVAGLNPYASPWDLWRRKTDQAPEPTQNPAMEWGNRLEPAIRQKYVDDTGLIVHVPWESLFHPDIKFARATPDGIVVEQAEDLADQSRWQHIVQCKNVGTWVEKAWIDAPPAYVQLQEQWEMFVVGLARADIAALIGGNDFRIYTIHRDDKIIADLLSIASDFWRRVEQRIPPAIDNSDACREHFEAKFAKSNAVEIVADAELDGLFGSWLELTRAIKQSTKEVERIRNVVRSHLADAQADRIVSSIGTAKLVKNENGKQTLYAPKTWAKETA